MFRKVFCQTVVVALLLGCFPCRAAAVSTSADCAILIEQQSGRVLYEYQADQEQLIASITKIMTAVVAIRYGTLNEKYTVTSEDMAEGSSMYLKPGDVLTLEELLYGLMLASGNDAALAVAHCVSGKIERFVDRMNETAEDLGMTHTHFANPNGLDAKGHYSSARDMACLAAAALENETFRRIVSTQSVTIGGRYLSNHNKLLRLCEGCIGLKTGFTKAAGRTLVSAVERDGMTLIAVTLNDGNDWQDHIDLYDYGFQHYRNVTLATAGQKLACTSIINGGKHSVMLAAAEDLSYPVTEGETLTLTIQIPVSVAAPVVSGQVIGRAYACLNGQEVASVDLMAMETVLQAENDSDGGFFYRLFHS